MMDNSRKIGDISNNTFGDNTNFQGDHVSLNKTVSSDQFNQDYDKLLKDILSIIDESKREDAKFLAELLKDSYSNKDQIKGQKIIKLLQSTIGTVASLSTIAKYFGLSLG